MLHPLFATILRSPGLVADHLANYGALVKDECGKAGRGIAARAVAVMVAAVAIALALGWAGVALMLGLLTDTFHWSLVAVPGGAAVIALVCGWFAARPFAVHGFDDLRVQFDADRRALHQAGAQNDR